MTSALSSMLSERRSCSRPLRREVQGRQAVIDYFTNAAAAIEFNPFVKPLEYYGSGDRVVIVGDETFKVKDTGETHQADWVWVIDMQDGLITRIDHVQDLTGVAEPVREALIKSSRHG